MQYDDECAVDQLDAPRHAQPRPTARENRSGARILEPALTDSSKAGQHSSSEDTFKSAVILAGMPALIGKVITSRIKMAPAQGLEPQRAVLETAMLPLHHAGVPDRGLEPR